MAVNIGVNIPLHERLTEGNFGQFVKALEKLSPKDELFKVATELFDKLDFEHKVRIKTTSPAKKNFNRFVMQFSKIESAFRKVKKTFDSLGKIGTPSELAGVLPKFGLEGLNEDTVAGLFKEADLDNSTTIEFKELLITLGCAYNKRIQGDGEFVNTSKFFKIIEDAFQLLDPEGQGYITQQTIRDSKIWGKEQTEERLKELDYNNDSEISLPEFIYCVSNWVFVDDDDERDM